MTAGRVGKLMKVSESMACRTCARPLTRATRESKQRANFNVLSPEEQADLGALLVAIGATSTEICQGCARRRPLEALCQPDRLTQEERQRMRDYLRRALAPVMAEHTSETKGE